MSYGYNNQYQPPYRPYAPAPQVWQQPVQQNWQQPAPQQTWQSPMEPPAVESIQQQEDPVVLAIRELTAEIAAFRKLMTPKAKKKEAEDE